MVENGPSKRPIKRSMCELGNIALGLSETQEVSRQALRRWILLETPLSKRDRTKASHRKLETGIGGGVKSPKIRGGGENFEFSGAPEIFTP